MGPSSRGRRSGVDGGSSTCPRGEPTGDAIGTSSLTPPALEMEASRRGSADATDVVVDVVDVVDVDVKIDASRVGEFAGNRLGEETSRHHSARPCRPIPCITSTLILEERSGLWHATRLSTNEQNDLLDALPMLDSVSSAPDASIRLSAPFKSRCVLYIVSCCDGTKAVCRLEESLGDASLGQRTQEGKATWVAHGTRLVPSPLGTIHPIQTPYTFYIYITRVYMAADRVRRHIAKIPRKEMGGRLGLALPVCLALSALSARAERTIRLASVEDVFVDGVMDEAWSDFSFGFSSVAPGALPDSQCYELMDHGAVSFVRDHDRVWVSSTTYLEAIIKVDGAADVLLWLEGLQGDVSVATEPVSAVEILVASQPDDEDVLDAFLGGDYVDLRVRLKDLLGDLDAEQIPLSQIVLSTVAGTVEGGDQTAARLCVAGVAIID